MGLYWAPNLESSHTCYIPSTKQGPILQISPEQIKAKISGLYSEPRICAHCDQEWLMPLVPALDPAATIMHQPLHPDRLITNQAGTPGISAPMLQPASTEQATPLLTEVPALHTTRLARPTLQGQHMRLVLRTLRPGSHALKCMLYNPNSHALGGAGPWWHGRNGRRWRHGRHWRHAGCWWCRRPRRTSVPQLKPSQVTRALQDSSA